MCDRDYSIHLLVDREREVKNDSAASSHLRGECHRGDLEVPWAKAFDVVPKQDLTETCCDLIRNILLEECTGLRRT